MHFYFFKSTKEGDSISGLTVFTSSRRKAFALASKCFVKCNCEGVPAIMTI